MDWLFSKDKSYIEIKPPLKKTKKITASRLGTVLGMNDWQSPFQGWCDMTKVYKDPFVESKYTRAGIAIEPIIIKYMNEQFDGAVRSTSEYYGVKDPARSYGYDFFKKESDIFGGMWDAVIVNDKEDIGAVIEIKTSSRPQDWESGVPDEKLVQTLYYGHQLKVKRSFTVVAFLSDEDYERPELFVPTPDNTKIYSFLTEEEMIPYDGQMCTITDLLYYAEQWWKAYILTGVSPRFDEKKDKDILKALRTAKPDGDEFIELNDILRELDKQEAMLAKIRSDNEIDLIEIQISACKEALKREMTMALGEDDMQTVAGRFTLSKGERTTVDTAKLKKDGIYDSYTKTNVSFTLRESKEKEDK